MEESMVCQHGTCSKRTLDPSGLCYIHRIERAGTIVDENSHLLSVVPPSLGSDGWNTYGTTQPVKHGQEQWDMYETDNPRPATRTERLRRLFVSATRRFRKPVIQPRGYDAFVPYKPVQGPPPEQGFLETDTNWYDEDGRRRPSQVHLDAWGDLNATEPTSTTEMPQPVTYPHGRSPRSHP